MYKENLKCAGETKVRSVANCEEDGDFKRTGRLAYGMGRYNLMQRSVQWKNKKRQYKLRVEFYRGCRNRDLRLYMHKPKCLKRYTGSRAL